MLHLSQHKIMCSINDLHMIYIAKLQGILVFSTVSYCFSWCTKLIPFLQHSQDAADLWTMW